jgi:phage recombination protein Bet
MTQELATREEHGLQLSTEQIELVKRTIAKDHSDDELALFINQCNRTGLDPFARQIYSIKRSGHAQTQVSIDGARLIAERSGRYRPGSVAWCGEDGIWHDTWMSDEKPKAAKVTVFKDDHPVEAIAHFSEYVQKTPTWNSMPRLMIAKCAEMLALRKAFPQDLSGLYSDDELPPAKVSVGEPVVARGPSIDPVTDEQVAELTELLSANPDRVSDLAKYLGRRNLYGTDDLRELSLTQAAALIADLLPHDLSPEEKAEAAPGQDEASAFQAPVAKEEA